MPKIDALYRTPDGLLPFQAPWAQGEFLSSLPTEQGLKSAGYVAANARAAASRASFQNWQKLSLRNIRSTGEVQGWVEQAIPSLDTFLGAMDQAFGALDAMGIDGRSLVGDAIGSFVPDLMEGFTNAIGSIPIVGWVVKLALAFGSLVQALTEGDQTVQPPAVCYARMQYVKTEDETWARSVLEAANGGQWTQIFSPIGTAPASPNVPSFACLKLTDELGNARGQRVEFAPAVDRIDTGTAYQIPGATFVDGQLGYLPGPCRQFAAFQGTGPGVASWRSTDAFYPSGRQLVGQLWSACNRNGPDAFRVAIGAVEAAWERWFRACFSAGAVTPGIAYPGGQVDCLLPGYGGGRGDCHLLGDLTCPIAVRERGGELEVWAYEDVQGMRRAIEATLAGRDRPRSGELSDAATRDAFAAFLARELTEETRNRLWREVDPEDDFSLPSSAGLGLGRHMRVSMHLWLRFTLEIYQRNLWRWAGTTTAAYVDPSFAGLWTPRVSQRWTEARAELLKRPLVRTIDLEVIPDDDYRAAVAQAQAAIPALLMRPGPAGGVLPGDEAELPPALPGVDPEDVGAGDGDGGGAILLLGAVGLAALALG